MFKDFITALLHKILTFLVSHKDLFEQKESEREKTLEKLSVPQAFKTYLLQISEDEFIEDLATILLYLQDSKNTEVKSNKFLKRLVEFLTTELARKIDHLDSAYYLTSKKEQVEIIEKLINAKSVLAEALKEILINYNYQQIAQAVQELANKTDKTPYIVVQTPREMDTEQKKQIRTELTKVWPLTLPTFQINRRLIGGLRVFIDGKTKDYSWLSRVLRYTSLTA